MKTVSYTFNTAQIIRLDSACLFRQIKVDMLILLPRLMGGGESMFSKIGSEIEKKVAGMTDVFKVEMMLSFMYHYKNKANTKKVSSNLHLT